MRTYLLSRNALQRFHLHPAFAGAVFIGFAAIIGCSAQDSSKHLDSGSPNNNNENRRLTSTASPTAGFVSDKQCAECHQELFDSYQQVGMAQSFYLPTQDKRIENIEDSHYFHPASNRHYEMFERDGDLYQARYQIDAAGKQVNRLEVKVDAILGSGNHVRSYLYEAPSGEWFQMPLAWYSQQKIWRMNPGYDNANHLGFQRKITRECMFCHNAFPLEMPPGSDEHWQPHIFDRETLPHGIGCQRCHGPGEKHIQLAREKNAGLDVQTSIVNPAKLPKERAEDVCLQCHLQPSSQILSELVHQDRGEFSFRPGQSLADFRALLDYELPKASTASEAASDDRFEINHHAYRMHQSKCYVESESMTCTTCHDPHKKITTKNRIASFRSSCLKCHEVASCDSAVEIEHADAPSSELADCIACHMPRRRTQDVIHAVMTDHKIVAIPEPEDVRLAVLTEPPLPNPQTKVVPYTVPNRSNDSSKPVDVYQAIASGQLGNQRATQSLRAYVDAKGNDAAILVLAELALALQNNGDVQGELETLLRTLQAYPNHVQANLEMGMALAAAGMPDRALTYYRRAQQIGPPLPETHVGLGMSMLARNDLESARGEFERAVELRPLYPEALLNLGIVCFALEHYIESEEFLRRALAADPTFTEAHQYLQQITKLR